jgi:hypothetical protein
MTRELRLLKYQDYYSRYGNTIGILHRITRLATKTVDALATVLRCKTKRIPFALQVDEGDLPVTGRC